MLKGRASTFYYNYLAGKGYNFDRIIYKLDIKDSKKEHQSAEPLAFG